MDTKMTLQECIEQLKSCNFECEAGKLESNAAFRQLEDTVERIDDVYYLLLNSANIFPISSVEKSLRDTRFGVIKYIITGEAHDNDQTCKLEAMGYLK